MSGGGSDILADELILNNEIRKRRAWHLDTDSLASVISQELDLLDLDVDVDEEEEFDGAGCPLPSTPEDTHLLEAEVTFFLSLLFLVSI